MFYGTITQNPPNQMESKRGALPKLCVSTSQSLNWVPKASQFGPWSQSDKWLTVLIHIKPDSCPLNPENKRMRPTTLLAIAATTALSMTTLAAPQAPQAPQPPQTSQAHSISVEASRVALTDASSFNQVRLGDTVEMAITLQDGTLADLQLERFSPFTPNARIVSVDAQGKEHTIDLSNDVHLRGHIAGDDSQVVYIAITQFGTSGFLEINNDTHVISTGKYNGQAKTSADLSVFPSNLLQIAPGAQSCAFDINNADLAPFGLQIADDFVKVDDDQAPQGTPPQRNAEIAIETDYEFTSWLFGGDTTASASYASTLLGAISTIYDRDVNTTLTIPYLRTYAANNDPYSGTDIIDFLDDVQTEFNSGGAAGVSRHIVHGMSARGLGGGVAYLSTICDNFYGVGVSANLDGFFPNPLQDNSNNNWDVIVASHELGHNFGTLHTHDGYDPPIDNCGNGDCSQAQDSTIMSYCHLCPGGLSNMDLRFHPRVRERILDFLQNDAPCDLVVTEACEADIVADGDLNFLDISAYLAAYSKGAPLADWNTDGDFNFLDISAFLASYSKGCP